MTKENGRSEGYGAKGHRSPGNEGDTAHPVTKENGRSEGRREEQRRTEGTKEDGSNGGGQKKRRRREMRGCMGIITRKRGKILNVRVLYVGKIP